MRSSSSGGSRRSRSARKAFVVSLIVSLVIVGGATALGVTSGGRDYGPDIKRLYDQVADLQQQNQRLEEALNRTRTEMAALRGGLGGDAAAAAKAAMAAAEAAGGTLGSGGSGQDGKPMTAAERRASLLSPDGIAAAAISALEDREEQQKRILFMQIPRCRRPNEDKLVICELSIRNNALTTTSIAFSQSGTSVSVEGGRMFTSVRMRQPGRPNFGYTTAISIPRETIGSIEVAFGPVREEANMLSSFAISANKSVYSFTKVPLE